MNTPTIATQAKSLTGWSIAVSLLMILAGILVIAMCALTPRGGAQQEGHEVRRHMRERLVVQRRCLVPESKFPGHPRLLLLVRGPRPRQFLYWDKRCRVTP